MKLAELVGATASGPNSSVLDLMDSLEGLAYDNNDINYGSLLGATIGLQAETGEFAELVKKHVFQGADFDRTHAKKELGDVLWYMGLACSALGIEIEDLLETVTEKLLKRYKNGFTVEESNNRVEGDI